jgi:hypothetical protein
MSAITDIRDWAFNLIPYRREFCLLKISYSDIRLKIILAFKVYSDVGVIEYQSNPITDKKIFFQICSCPFPSVSMSVPCPCRCSCHAHVDVHACPCRCPCPWQCPHPCLCHVRFRVHVHGYLLVLVHVNHGRVNVA